MRHVMFASVNPAQNSPISFSIGVSIANQQREAIIIRLRREIKAYIECEIRDYNQTLREIGDLRNDLILETAIVDNNGGGHSSTPGDPTQAKAFKLMTNRRIRQMERTAEAISTVINDLPEDKYRLIELRYWKKPKLLTDDGIAMELSCSRATLYNWVDGILIAIAKQMGLID